ncbi:MAG: hypothetical protein KBT11_06010 [Treponema sp.]|nr:hypothetical protein [Candidatus Treponema equifaecale]
MALLQVRDFPQELYTLLALKAELENRSITQQTIHMLKESLQSQNQGNLKRFSALAGLNALNLNVPESIAPADLIRQDRDR